MKVLVTGGAGFIGANFLHYTLQNRADADVLNIDSLTYAACPASLAGLENTGRYRFEQVDITDEAGIDRVFEAFKPELVVHFAAESHVDRSIQGPRAFVKTNVEGTLNLLEAARKHFPKGGGLFHHVSTDEVYGSLGPEGYFMETTPYDPSSPYSASKAGSDHLVRAYQHTYGLPTKLTNCSNNYGPRQFPEKLIPLVILNLLERKPLPIYGNGSNIRDWLFVDDHCSAIWAVIDRGGVGETYNIGGNQERTNLQVVDALCASVAAATGVSADELLALKTFVADRPGHDQRYAIDASKVKRECGWEPAETFETGIEQTVRWYLDNADWVELVRSGEYRKWLETNYADRGEGSDEGASA